MPHRPKTKYRLCTYSIKQLLEEYQTIDCEPVGQRPPIFVKNNKKSKEIVRTLLEGIGLGQITLMKLPKDSPGGPFGTYVLESIDGGHRKRAIFEFYTDCFSVKYKNSEENEVEKYYSDLSEEEKSAFLETEFPVAIYNTLNVQQKGHLFRTLNKTSLVNFMESCNSYGDIPIANFIRELVRTVKGINNSHHELFDYCRNSTTSHKYLSFDNNRLKQEYALARIVLRYAQYPDQLLGGSEDEDIGNMYASEVLDEAVKEKVENHVDFLQVMGVWKKEKGSTGLSQQDFKALSFLYFWMIDEYGLFVIKDAEEFMKIYLKAKTTILKVNGKYDKKNMKDSSGYSFRTAYVKYINAPQNTKKVNAATEILVEEMTVKAIKRVITVKDSKRCFNVVEKEDRLIEQNWKCYIDGEKLDYKDAEAAHIVAYSKGGKTEVANLAMVRKKWNQDMGSMDLEEYKAIHEKKKAA